MARPLKYTVEEVENIINHYFEVTPEHEYTITGLALLFGSRQLLIDYENREEYSDIIKTAKLRVENSYEKELRGKYFTGAIFALKNFGWKDERTTEHKGGVTVGSPLDNIRAKLNIDKDAGADE